MQAGNKQRLFYLDLIRVIAMLLIVIGHYGISVNECSIIGFASKMTSFANGSIMAPAITMFFMVSGASLMIKYKENIKVKEFYLNRIKRIFPLFWLAYGIAFSVNFLLNKGVVAGVPSWKILFSAIGMDGYFLYLGSNFYILGEWFLGAIILFYLAFPLLKNLMDKYPRIIAVITVGVYVWVQICNPFQIPLERNLIVCFASCILGMYLAKYVNTINVVVGISATVASLVLMLIPIDQGALYISHILGGTLYIALFWLGTILKNGSIKRWCSKLSKRSYCIFLVHHVIIVWVLWRFRSFQFGKFNMLVLTVITFVLIYSGAFVLEQIYGKIKMVIESIIDKIYNGILKSIYAISAFFQQHLLISTICVVSLMGMIVYHKFLFGDYLYMATYDATEQFWPYLSFLRDYLLSEGFPTWSFSIGLGSVIDYSNMADAFYLILILAGKYLMPYLFGWLHLIKIILAATFMFLYLKKINLTGWACSFGAISYAFCSVIMIRGNWYHYASEMVYLALLLYLMECFFREKKWKCMTLLLIMIFSGRGAYFLCLYTIIILGYALVRYWIVDGGRWKTFGAYIWKCARIYLLSLLMSGIFWIPSLYRLLTSDRVGERIISRTPIFSLENLTMICNGILRSFKFDLAGSVDFYHSEYLNAMLFYIGISAIFFIICSVCYSKGKGRKLVIVFLTISGLYICWPDLRFLLNGFIAYEHTKLSSAWIVAGMAICGAYGFQKVFEENRLKRKTLIITMLSMGIVVCFCYFENLYAELEVRRNALLYIFVFVVIYFILLNFVINNAKNRNKIMGILFLVVCIELTIFSYQASDGFTTSSHIVTKDDLTEIINEREDIFERIKASSEEPFYRISANEYYNYANPMFANYWDSSYYSTTIRSYGIFCKEVVPSSYSGVALGNGIDNNIALESLIGSKYIIKKQGEVAPYGCIYVETYNGFDIYENPYAQSIGVTYDSVISEEMFQNLNETEKGLALAHSVMIDGGQGDYFNMDAKLEEDFADMQSYLKEVEYKLCEEYFSTYKGIDETKVTGNLSDQMRFETGEKNSEISVVICKERESLNYQVSFNVRSDIETKIEVVGSDGSGGYFSKEYQLKEGENEINFNAEKKKVQYFLLRFRNEGNYDVSNLTIKYQSLENYMRQYNNLYESYISERMNENFVIEQFSQNKITGNVTVSQDKILLFSIPFDEGWQIFVDEIPVEVLKGDYGLMAVELAEGYHNVQLKYVSPFLRTGVGFTCVGVIWFAVVIIIEHTIRRKENVQSINRSASV